ncbi:cobalamin B12-binding domain-containing protein [Roseisalinus antarcticus]|uniref:B12 binding domain protein n=1 Tax=Roseisalinus antarcticus TaxID=254357 RepID=A0A1Y5S3V0_9RHOB|nr:cobalamin B12-binding domain-containing protein [Roseisalinus antarcticus]SLN32049.1 B12 binding domain protein [Roseisalinus antarcticus]
MPIDDLDQGYVVRLDAAARSTDSSACAILAREMIRNGITREEIADHYVPALARWMGECWVADEMSFAEVSIGVARLQTLLREVGPDWRADVIDTDGETSVLVVVPDAEQHTLGAVALAGQLRRLGLSVKLWLGYRAEEAHRVVAEARYDAVFLSLAHHGTLESVRDIITLIKKAAVNQPPIVVGGAIVGPPIDIRTATGADHVTNDVNEALRLCRLSVRSGQTAPREMRS